MEQLKARIDLVGRPPEDACDCVCHDVGAQTAQSTARSGGLVHGVTRHDTTFAGLVALALMALCVVGSPGTPLFVGAIAGGGVFAVLLHSARGRKRTSIARDEPDS